MAAQQRLPPPYGRLIQREAQVPFSFEGRRYQAHPGDTVASALYAHGVKTLARSFKYHRPRGVLSMSGFDANVLVQIGSKPNQRADSAPLKNNLPAVGAQNRSGTAERDYLAALGWLERFLPVGFYYRTFFRPQGSWSSFYEKIIRRLSGLGTVDNAALEYQRSDKRHLFCDVAVVGGGLAGMSAALRAAQGGAEALLFDSGSRLGGASSYGDEAACRSGRELIAQIEQEKNLDYYCRATAQGLFEDNWLAVEAEDRFYKVRARQVILAAGAYEQILVFRNNDLPGVMLCSAARRLLWHYGIRPGRRAVVCTVNDDGLDTALMLHQAGVEVAAVADWRRHAAPQHERLDKIGAVVHTGCGIYEAKPTRSWSSWPFGGAVGGVRLARIDEDRRAKPFGKLIPCDLVCMAGGYVPALSLACHQGSYMACSEKSSTLGMDEVPDGVQIAGKANGVYGQTRADGIRAAERALAALGMGETAAEDDRADPHAENAERNHPFPIVPHPAGKEFVDLDEDLSIRDVENGIADGFDHGELLKRYSTAGMGPSQGRQSMLPVLRLAAQARGLPCSLTATTTRPPLNGETFRLLAGQRLTPYRCSLMHGRHLELGAQFLQAGLWYRPNFYGPREREEETALAEARVVRQGVGLIDVSTLGGLEVRGPDAAAFLNRCYTTGHAKHPVGRVRYVLLCDDSGAIVDDGVAVHYEADHFYVSASTTHVDATYHNLTWLNAQYNMNLDVINVSSAFAAVNIAGPLCREVLQPLVDDLDLSAESFPYMAAGLGHVARIPARIIRIGFVGELGYEIHVPAHQGMELWDCLMQAGKTHHIRPFGVGTQRLLRLEKGHIIVGQDTDGLTTPLEANMSWAIGKKKTEYIGRAAIETRRRMGLERVLVGFRLQDRDAPVPPECCLVVDGDQIGGRVTSAARSESCEGDIIGLAFVPPGKKESGSVFQIKLPDGKLLRAVSSRIPFYDPENKRQDL